MYGVLQWTTGHNVASLSFNLQVQQFVHSHLIYFEQEVKNVPLVNRWVNIITETWSAQIRRVLIHDGLNFTHMFHFLSFCI